MLKANALQGKDDRTVPWEHLATYAGMIGVFAAFSYKKARGRCDRQAVSVASVKRKSKHEKLGFQAARDLNCDLRDLWSNF